MRKIDFWQKLKNSGTPILALAPMAGFTDSAFRRLCRRYGADVVYSEMVSATALAFNKKRRGNKTLDLAAFDRRRERYYVVQLFGSQPEHFAVAARVISDYIKPDGIDINFGCPAGKVLKQGAGADLMKNPEQARAIVQAVLENTKLPVSIKIRAAAGENGALDFLRQFSDLPISALMIHGRTLSQGFVGQPNFSLIKASRHYFKGVILANGGIVSVESAAHALKASGADGLGLARGALGRPWLFSEIKAASSRKLAWPTVFKVMREHAVLEYKLKGRPGLIELRKHLPWYVQGLPGAGNLRSRLVKISSLKDLDGIIKFWKEQNKE